MAFTRWYLQVDAGLVASHVRRLKFLYEDEDDAHEEPEVHLRSKGKADGNDAGQSLSTPASAYATIPPTGPPSPIQLRSQLDSRIRNGFHSVEMTEETDTEEFHRSTEKWEIYH